MGAAQSDDYGNPPSTHTITEPSTSSPSCSFSTPLQGERTRRVLARTGSRLRGAGTKLRFYSREAAQLPSSFGPKFRNVVREMQKQQDAKVSKNLGRHTSGEKRRSVARDQLTAEIALRLRHRLYGRGGLGTYAHSDAAAKLIARRARGEPLSLREAVFLLVEEPSASLAGLSTEPPAPSATRTPPMPSRHLHHGLVIRPLLTCPRRLRLRHDHVGYAHALRRLHDCRDARLR